jgi:hypothetical protein
MGPGGWSTAAPRVGIIVLLAGCGKDETASGDVRSGVMHHGDTMTVKLTAPEGSAESPLHVASGHGRPDRRNLAREET